MVEPAPADDVAPDGVLLSPDVAELSAGAATYVGLDGEGAVGAGEDPLEAWDRGRLRCVARDRR